MLLWLMNMGFAGGTVVTPPGTSSGLATTDKFTLGTKEPMSITGTPTLGGKWSWAPNK